MKANKLQVYDPPMCCSTGVCGTSVKPELAQFAADLEWLRQQGVGIERFSLSSQPAAFVAQEAVSKTLKAEGNGCLPLVVVDNVVVSKGAYPSRSQLMVFARLDGATVEERADEPVAACGPGCSCNCGTPAGNRKMKVAVSLVALLAVAGILAYKASTAKSSPPSCGPATGNATFFTDAQAVVAATPDNAGKITAPNDKPADQKIWAGLESLATLNQVAGAQDAVFIFVPAKKGEAADAKTNAAAVAAQQALKAQNIILGLYALTSSSPDYTVISAKVQPPAMLVMSKGKGMTAVTGEMSESKLLQAYVATAKAGGGCGPSGCGPSSSGCN